MDVSSWLRKQLEETSPDLLRAMVKEFAEALMSADADAVCGAGYGERTPERVNRRNGYRERDWDTRVGSIELAVPKLREGSYFPDWLLEPRRRAGQGFGSVIARALFARVATAEDGAAWLAFIRGLVARGLNGVKLVSSDAHPGLVDAIAATLPGASWQRCRTHFMRNLLTRVPKSAQGFVATMVRTIFAQPDAATVHEQHARIVAQLEARFPEAAALLDEAGPDLLALTGFPKGPLRDLWSNNSLETLNT